MKISDIQWVFKKVTTHIFFVVGANTVTFRAHSSHHGDSTGSTFHDGSLQSVQTAIEYFLTLFPYATHEIRFDTK